MGFSDHTRSSLQYNRSLRRSRQGHFNGTDGLNPISVPELSNAERSNRCLLSGRLSDLHAARKRRESLLYGAILVGSIIVVGLIAWWLFG